MMPCPRENRGSLDALSWGCHMAARLMRRCCLLLPHLPIRHNKTSEPSSAGWLNNSSPLLLLFLLHTGDGATVTCVNSNPSHNTVCTPQACTQGCTVSKKKKICSFCLNSNMSRCSRSAVVSVAAGLSDIEPPHLLRSSVSFLSLHWACLPAAECDAQWQRGAYMPLVRSVGR